MPAEIARQWFVPGDGIDRHVITGDIQRYLGNDATVRPGTGTGTDEVRSPWQICYIIITIVHILNYCRVFVGIG